MIDCNSNLFWKYECQPMRRQKGIYFIFCSYGPSQVFELIEVAPIVEIPVGYSEVAIHRAQVVREVEYVADGEHGLLGAGCGFGRLIRSEERRVGKESKN